MTAVASIRGGLKAALDQMVLPNGFQVVEYQLSVPTPPTIHFFPEKVVYDKAGSRGSDEWTWGVQAFVSLTLEQGAQMTLDSFLAASGPSSVKQALEADSQLGGVIDDLRVTENAGYQMFEARELVLGSTWTVQMLVQG